MKIIAVVPALVISVGLLVVLWTRRGLSPRQTIRSVVAGLLSINGLVFLFAIGMMLISLGNPIAVLAQQPTAIPTTTTTADPSMGAALATGLACIGAGIAVGISGAAAIGGITEKPEILGKSLIFVGLAEGIAIYGLIISFMILSR
ncbi:MAG: ATP synthase subunit C [Anaerolineae bacterium]